MAVKRLTAIIITEPQPVTGNTALKYHNIPEEGKGYSDFLNFASRFPGVIAINFYYKKLPGETKGRFKEKIHFR